MKAFPDSELAADQTIHTPEMRFATACLHGKSVTDDCDRCRHDLHSITRRNQKG